MLTTLSESRELSHAGRAHFDLLMQASYRQAYSLAYRLTGHTAEAEDLVQESFLRAYRFFHRYDSSLPFSSWLYRIMNNAYVDSLRRRGKLKTSSLDQAGVDGNSAWDIADQRPSADRAMQDEALQEPIQRALCAMNPEFRTAVILADVEGMAYEEVAEIMDTSVGTVRSRIHRGRKQLRNYLEQFAPQLCKENQI